MSGSPGLRIGELAARSGRSVHAIRWYDAQGLIPGVRRDAGGQRRFGAGHVQWLAFVDRLRRTGMSIARIRAYTRLVQQRPQNVPAQRELLAAHRAQVAAEIAAWQESLALIDAKLAFYDDWIAGGRRPDDEPGVTTSTASRNRPAATAPRARRARR